MNDYRVERKNRIGRRQNEKAAVFYDGYGCHHFYLLAGDSEFGGENRFYKGRTELVAMARA